MTHGSRERFSRWLVWLALGLMLALAGGCSKPEPRQVLRVLAWPGYADPDVVARFEQQYNAKLDVSFISSDDELWSKLNDRSGDQFDVFAVNTAELKRYIDTGISVPLELEKIPNTHHQLPRFEHLDAIPGITRDGKVYGIPYTYSAMGLIYNRDLVKQPPTSMAAMWDPQYQGKVLAYDGSNHNFTIAALILGIEDPFHLNDAQFHQVVNELIRLRRNVLTFYRSPEEAVDLYRKNKVALVFGNYGSQQVKQLQDAGANIGYVIPREGALAWLDCWSVTKYARNRLLAEKWINFTLEQDNSTVLTQREGLANTVTPSPAAMAADKIIWIRPVEDFTKRARLWAKIRSGDVPELF